MPDEKKGEDGKIIPPVVTEKVPEPTQSPIKKELEKINKVPKSKAAQIRFNIQRMTEDLERVEKEEKGEVEIDPDKEKPVTVGMLEDIEKKKAQATALSLADSIADEDERELTKHYLQTRIVPSGNPTEDLRLAQSLVNSLKNQQVAEEIARKNNGGKPTVIPTGNGGPAKPPESEFVPTAAEQGMMKAPFNLSKEDILKARALEAASQK